MKKRLNGGFNMPMRNNSNSIFIGVLIFILIIFFIILIIRAFQYRNLSCSPRPSFLLFALTNDRCNSSDSDSSLITMPIASNEVFHISNQDYTYDQAQCKCASYGSKLATYEQLVEAYNKGADWCSYGWMEGQRAYYPTQKCSWDKLQTGPAELKNACGAPGVNGGFFANSNMKFGATCYGVKPPGQVVKPKTATCTTGICDRAGNEDANSQKPTDQIAPFSNNQWAE